MTAARRGPVYAALSAGSALILSCAPAQYLGRQQDDLLYIVASQSLSHGSYRLETAVGRPLMLTITPGWPVLLLPVSWLAPSRLGAYEVFSALLQACVPWAVWWWARRRASEWTAVLIALLCAASPVLLSQAGAVMSETAFLLCSLAFLAALEEERGARAGGWLCTLTQLRPAGLSLFPAAAAGFLRRRDWKGLSLALGLPASLYAAWAAGSAFALRHAHAGAGKIAYEGRSWGSPLALGGFAKALFYARALGGQFLPRSLGGGALPAALGGALLLLAAWGCARELRRRWDEPASQSLFWTAVMLAIWAWNYERYLIPALPLLWWAAAAALGRSAKPVLAAALALELVFAAPAWVRGTSWRAPELSRTYAWLEQNVGPGEALASAVYVRDGLLSGHPGAPLPDADAPEAFAAQLRAQRVRYALWQDDLDIGTAGGSGAYLRQKLDRAGAILRNSSFFDIVYSDAGERSAVFRLKEPR